MAVGSKPLATIDDLAHVDQKAELIAGRIVLMSPTGHMPNQVAGRIYRRLADHVDQLGQGCVYTDNMGFVVAKLASGRESFSPDVSYFTGPVPRRSMKFVRGAPTFAVEVRSEGDFGPHAETEIAAKRADYFAAGTLVVWDVDPEAEVIDVYRRAAPIRAERFGRGQLVDAEPAVTGWKLNVDAVFGPKD